MRSWTLFCAAACFVPAAANADDTQDVLGRWYTDGNESQVEIFTKTTDNGEVKFFGRLVWFADPVYGEEDAEAGKPLRDRNNPDEEKRNDPLLNLVFITNFVYNEKSDKFEDGRIYDPESGKTYKATMRLVEDPEAEGGKKLDVRGYIGIPAFGRTTSWLRVPEEDLASDGADDSAQPGKPQADS